MDREAWWATAMGSQRVRYVAIEVFQFRGEIIYYLMNGTLQFTV